MEFIFVRWFQGLCSGLWLLRPAVFLFFWRSFCFPFTIIKSCVMFICMFMIWLVIAFNSLITVTIEAFWILISPINFLKSFKNGCKTMGSSLWVDSGFDCRLPTSPMNGTLAIVNKFHQWNSHSLLWHLSQFVSPQTLTFYSLQTLMSTMLQYSHYPLIFQTIEKSRQTVEKINSVIEKEQIKFVVVGGDVTNVSKFHFSQNRVQWIFNTIPLTASTKI